MKNFWTIFKREFLAYFNAPIAYIFIIVFLVVNCGLYMTSFFLAELADMRGFFGALIITLVIFIPAITMRLWAEDRKGGTLLLLQSFPMKPQTLVLGKFFASFAFYLVALAGTFPIPILLTILGNPDTGPIVGGYLGAALLGAFFLSVGIFISGLFKEQILAFIMGMVSCFVFYMLGTDYIATVLDGWIQGLGSFLMGSMGTAFHFASIERGVLDLRDILYFLSYTAAFLILNAYTVEQKFRRQAGSAFAVAAVILLAVAIMFNVVVERMNLGRFDLTEDKIYSISPSTKVILGELKDAPVQVNYYISPKEKLPSAMQTMERDVGDKLQELAAVSEKFRYQIIDPTADAEALKKLEEKGVLPFDAQTIEQDAFGIKRVYSTISIGYLDRKEEVIPQVLPASLGNLEYELLSRIHRLTMEEKPMVGIVSPMQDIDPRQRDPKVREWLRRMGQDVPEVKDNYSTLPRFLRQEGYEVERVGLIEGQPIPKKVQTLAVIDPTNLAERQLYEIDRFLASGGNVLMAVQNYRFTYEPNPQGEMRIRPMKNRSAVNQVLERYGLSVSEEILMDTDHEVLSIPVRKSIGSLITTTVMTPVKLPIQIRVTPPNMSREVSITNNVGALLYLWGTALSVDRARTDSLGLIATTLFESSPESWTIPSTLRPLLPGDINPREHDFAGKQLLALLAAGQFPQAFEGEPVPAWPELPGDTKEETVVVEEESEPIVPGPGKLLLVGCAEMFSDNLIGAYGNGLFFINAVDALTLGEHLINIRSKFQTSRLIKKTSPGAKIFYRFFVIILVPVILAVIGIVRYIYRRRRREAYQRLLSAEA